MSQFQPLLVFLPSYIIVFLTQIEQIQFSVSLKIYIPVEFVPYRNHSYRQLPKMKKPDKSERFLSISDLSDFFAFVTRTYTDAEESTVTSAYGNGYTSAVTTDSRGNPIKKT